MTWSRGDADPLATTEPLVPSETYVPDGQFEEERIMAERAAAPRTLDASTLRVPISTLALPKPFTLTANAVICDAVNAMQEGNFGAVLIVDAAGKLTGIFTERDLISKIAGKGLDWKKTPLEAYMTANPEALEADANMTFCLNMMTIGGYRHVPIVDANKKPVAVVSIRDVVRYITGFFEKEVTNLPPRANLLKPTKREDG